MFRRTENFSQYIRLYPIISILLAVTITIHLLTLIPVIGPTIINYGIGFNYGISQGDWWRLVTPIFLHADFMHLLFNMFALFVFGPELEQLIGRMRFLTLYLLSGIFANIATFFIHAPDYLHYGASGAIFGLFGAYGALIYYTKNKLPELRGIMLPLIIISVVMTFVQSNINITGHIIGLLVGFLIGLSYFNPKRITSWRKKRY